MNDAIGLLCPAPGGLHHRTVEPALGGEDARRVDDDDLGIPHLRHAAHGEPRRLHLMRDDGDLGPDKAVGKCGLAGIRRTNDGAKPGTSDIFIGHSVPVSVLSIKAAAWRSASRLEEPVAAALPMARRTSTS